MEFRWIEWNIAKCHKHGVDPEAAQYVADHARRPFPRRVENQKYLVWGQDKGGRYLQVAYTIDADGTAFIIHARPLDDSEKRQLRRKKR